MNFLLDENFPKSAERLLVDLGHHVIDIRGSHLQGADDFQLFDSKQLRLEKSKLFCFTEEKEEIAADRDIQQLRKRAKSVVAHQSVDPLRFRAVRLECRDDARRERSDF